MVVVVAIRSRRVGTWVVLNEGWRDGGEKRGYVVVVAHVGWLLIEGVVSIRVRGSWMKRRDRVLCKNWMKDGSGYGV